MRDHSRFRGRVCTIASSTARDITLWPRRSSVGPYRIDHTTTFGRREYDVGAPRQEIRTTLATASPMPTTFEADSGSSSSVTPMMAATTK